MKTIPFEIRNAVARALALALLTSTAAGAGPLGGEVIAGSATIDSAPGNTVVHQSSQRAVLNWQSFDIGVAESVRFVQPGSDAVALNRVLGADPSRILGNLSANGNVFLVNPNGVVFGANARVNVGGLVASTRDIADSDFVAGQYRFRGDSTGSVLHQGRIEADGGYVALLGAKVSNEGVISARFGTVALAAGSALTLDVVGDGLITVGVDSGAVDALVQNSGVVRADGGRVLLTARSASDLLQSAVNNTGLVQARTLENRDGVIRLLGDMQSGTASVAGTLDASAPDGGRGGFIETSAAHVLVDPAARVTTNAPRGASGQWLIDPFDFTIAASGGDMTGATLSASLANGNVTIQSTSGAAGHAGDINVNDTVSWNANRLTLSALNDINVKTAMNGSGTAQLALEYGQGAVAAGNLSVVDLRAPVDLPAGNNFSTRLGSDGTVTNYTVITSLGAAGSTTGTDLQGIDGGLAANYALGTDIDASATSSWNAGAGFSPLGIASTFTGIFDGLGHTVSNLTISRASTNAVGLFGVANNATFRNVGVTQGSISGRTYVGLLVGNSQSGTYSNLHSTGTVTGFSYVGGLMGLLNGGAMDKAWSSANVRGTSTLVGGLIGQARFYGTITNAYATGTVNGSGASLVGGLIGQLRYITLSNGYATGSVTGSSQVGGLVGFLDITTSTIVNSYAAGAVSGSSLVGGLVGLKSGTVTGSFWDTTTSGRANAYGSGLNTGATGLTTAQMKAASSFTGWNFSSTWIAYDGHTYPLLRSFMTPLTVTAADATRTYDGLAYSGGNGVLYSLTPDGNLLGTLTYGGTAQGAVNAGGYTLAASGLYSNQLGYIISYADGVLTIDPAVLTATVVAQDKVYDGNTLADATLTLTGFIGSEALAVSHDAAVFNSKDVASAGWVTVGNITLADGSNGGLASNYVVAPTKTAVAHIQRRELKITGQAAADKVYDGTTDATLSGGSLGGVVAGDAVLLHESGVFATSSVGSDISVTATNSLGGAGSANYSLIQPVGLSASITAPPVTPVTPVPEVPQNPALPQVPEVQNLPVTPAPPDEPSPPRHQPPVGYERAVGHAISTDASILVSAGAASPGAAPPPVTTAGASRLARYDLAGLNLSVEGQGLSLPPDLRPGTPLNEE